MADDLEGALHRTLAATGGGSVRIENLARLSGGASRETWSFTAVTGDRRRRLILQRVRGDRKSTRLNSSH